MLVTAAAVADGKSLLRQGTDGILDGLPSLIGAYVLGSSALAADWYDDLREESPARRRFIAEPVIPDRAEKIRRAALWVVKAMTDDNVQQAPESRVAEVVQLEVARAHRDTITENRRRDPESAGWKRIARSDGCKFCRMLAGAVYTKTTARFAAHGNCNCVAQPWFRGQPLADPANVAQYVASQRTRTPAEKSRLRDLLNADYPDAPG